LTWRSGTATSRKSYRPPAPAAWAPSTARAR
jgi:hypothetical protein